MAVGQDRSSLRHSHRHGSHLTGQIQGSFIRLDDLDRAGLRVGRHRAGGRADAHRTGLGPHAPVMQGTDDDGAGVGVHLRTHAVAQPDRSRRGPYLHLLPGVLSTDRSGIEAGIQSRTVRHRDPNPRCLQAPWPDAGKSLTSHKSDLTDAHLGTVGGDVQERFQKLIRLDGDRAPHPWRGHHAQSGQVQGENRLNVIGKVKGPDRHGKSPQVPGICAGCHDVGRQRASDWARDRSVARRCGGTESAKPPGERRARGPALCRFGGPAGGASVAVGTTRSASRPCPVAPGTRRAPGARRRRLF